MTDRKALAREIVEVKSARMKRTRVEGERGRRGQDLMEYEAAIRFIAWTLSEGVDL